MKPIILATIGIFFSAWQVLPVQLVVPVRELNSGTMVTVKLRVHVIPTSYGSGAGGGGKYPRTVSLRIPTTLEDHASAYGAADQIWFAPRGWIGTAGVGADGSASVKLYPLSGYSTAGPYFIYSTAGGCAGCAMDDAAPYFPVAKKQALELGDGGEQTPPGIEIHRLSPHLVRFSLSGTPGIMVRGTAFYSGNSDYFYAQVKLALPRSKADLLKFLLQHYIVGFRAMEKSN